MEREKPNKPDVLGGLYNYLSTLYYLENQGWNVKTMIKEVKDKIDGVLKENTEERLSQLREELENEQRKTMPSTNS